MIPVLRFAPTPNGRLHLGHAYSAWLNARLAHRLNGRFLVRMEDIDATRCTVELAEHCLHDLAWLGLEWETPVRIQSQHLDDYAVAFNALKNMGLVYPCFCSRREIASASNGYDPDGAPLYSGTCRHLQPNEAQQRMAAGEAHAWRLDMRQALKHVAQPLHYDRFHPDTLEKTEVAIQPECWGDVVVIRKEIPTSYHLSVAVDDALQGVTHIVRGADLEAATDVHVVLQALLGLPTPYYYHHSLITDSDGKLSKSKGSQSLADLRASGITAGEVQAMLGL